MNIGSERWSKKECLPGYTGLLQVILGEFFYKLGYAAGCEIDLRIDPNWQPRPDVAAALEVEQPYPTKPGRHRRGNFIRRPDDQSLWKMSQLCARIGIPQIFVFDPAAKTAWEWNRETDNLERIQMLSLGNGSKLEVNDIWAELEARMRRKGTTKPAISLDRQDP